MLYQFDVDDVALGNTYAVVSQGSRRLLLKNLLTEEIEFLKFLIKNRCFQREQISEKMFTSLQNQSLILDSPKLKTNSQRISNLFKIPSSSVTQIVRPLLILFSHLGAYAALICIFLLYFFTNIHFAKVQDFSHWVTNVNILDAAITMSIIIFSMIFHEFGHATACLKTTGSTGSIRIINYRGTPGMAVDVSSICMTDKYGKALVASSGALFQSIFGLILLASNYEAFRMGASMAILGAVFCLSPLPNTDGYWLIRDFFNIPLRPSFWLRKSPTRWSDLVYGYVLLTTTIGLAFMLFQQCFYLLDRLSIYADFFSLSNVFIAILLPYMFVVTCIFIWKNIKMFFEH